MRWTVESESSGDIVDEREAPVTGYEQSEVKTTISTRSRRRDVDCHLKATAPSTVGSGAG
jgi:hypothetical protein